MFLSSETLRERKTLCNESFQECISEMYGFCLEFGTELLNNSVTKIPIRLM